MWQNDHLLQYQPNFFSTGGIFEVRSVLAFAEMESFLAKGNKYLGTGEKKTTTTIAK